MLSFHLTQFIYLYIISIAKVMLPNPFIGREVRSPYSQKYQHFSLISELPQISPSQT